ncbi:MAG: extracellular solute-binding protein, partial [Actinobacteria bacterium]|nr:extracellular solute-binding protein [Actinomycetota bacterium]
MNLKDKNFINTVIALFIIMVMAMVPFAGCKADTAPKELTVYVWEGYLPDKVVEIFEEETGITLNVNLISDNAAIFTLLKGGGEADIIMPTQNQVNRFYTEDLAQPIDLEKLSNYANITGTFKNQKWSMWDGSQMGTGQTYVVPYVFGTSGIIINTEKY